MGKTEDGKFARRLIDEDELDEPSSSTTAIQFRLATTSNTSLNRLASFTNIKTPAAKKAKPSFMKGVIIKKKSNA